MPKIVPQLAGAFLLAALFLAAVTWNRGQVLVSLADGGTLVVLADGDCQSRMQRAALVTARPGTIVRTHDFENHPAGTVPHTTAPMDYLIAVLGIFVRPPELAGAWVSPLLGLLTLLFLFFWSRTIDLRPRGPMLFLFALSPALTHAFALGRPDHQSLLVALTVTALAANFAFVRTARPAWAWASASLWGFALWVSWFEPLVLLAAQELGRAIALRKAAYAAVWPRGLLLTASLALAAWALEGFRNPWPDPVVQEFFPRWAALLGELQGTTPQAMFAWTGWLLVPAPFLLAWSYGKTRDPLALIVLVLLAGVTALTGWQARWNPWLASVFCLALPWILRPLAKPWLVWLVFVASLWPVAAAWEARTFPSPQEMARRQEARAEAALLAQTADFLRSQPHGGVMAPWWISPALARQSGLPMVGGTSHQSLPGTVDTARFFLSEDDAAAFAQLRLRQVKYVVTDAPERVVPTSAALLGIPAPRDPLIIRLARGRKIPDFLQPVFANPYFRIYKIRDE